MLQCVIRRVGVDFVPSHSGSCVCAVRMQKQPRRCITTWMAVTWPHPSDGRQTPLAAVALQETAKPLTFIACLHPALQFNANCICIFVISLTLSFAPPALPPPLLGSSIFANAVSFTCPRSYLITEALTHPLDKYRCVTVWCHQSCQVKWSRLTARYVSQVLDLSSISPW